MNKRNIITSNSFGREDNRVFTSFLIVGITLMLLSGLKTLRFLRDFRFTLVEKV